MKIGICTKKISNVVLGVYVTLQCDCKTVQKGDDGKMANKWQNFRSKKTKIKQLGWIGRESMWWIPVLKSWGSLYLAFLGLDSQTPTKPRIMGALNKSKSCKWNGCIIISLVSTKLIIYLELYIQWCRLVLPVNLWNLQWLRRLLNQRGFLLRSLWVNQLGGDVGIC